MLHLATKRKPSTGSRPYLHWLFVAFFADGSVITQTNKGEDGHSMMIDVTAKQKDSQLTHFELRNGKQAVTVDLTTGNFIVNGTPVQIHDQYFEPGNHKLDLVYFRETRAERRITGEVQQDGSVSREDEAIAHFVNRYFIGWEADDKKNTKVTLAVG